MIHQVVLFEKSIDHLSLFLFEDYTPAFSRLAFAKKAPTDLFGSSIPDARCHLAKCLQTLTSTHPNQVRSIDRFSKKKNFHLDF